MCMSMINVQNLTFSYDGSYDNVFENASFKIDTNWKLGFIGRNGRGKTTFLKLLTGQYRYRGDISSDVSFEYFPFEVADKSCCAVDIIREKAHLTDYECWKIQKELSLMDVNEEVLYRPFESLSGGEQVKILLAGLFLKRNTFLLIDEPTNHLDAKTKQAVGNYLKLKKGFILVSHDRYFLDSCVDHILSLNKTYIEIQKGNFSSWYKNKQNRDNFEKAQNEKLKKDIKRLKDSAKQNSDWSDKVEKTKNGIRVGGLKPDKGKIGHKAAKMMKRSKNIENRKQSAIKEKSKLLKNAETLQHIKISFLKHTAKKFVEFKNASLLYGNRKVCDNISFEVNEGERIALGGKNGCGKSTVLKFINGDNIINLSGSYNKSRGLKISYVSQDTTNLSGNLKNFAKDTNIEESLFKAILRKFDFSRTQFEKDICNFSEGQKKKVLIAKSLCEQAHLYLWDEPLNFIDVFSRIQIEDLILKFKPTILFVEHDKAFTEKVATKIVYLN